MTSNLPARREPVAPPAPTPAPVTVAREAAGLWAAKWSSIDKLTADDLQRVAAIVLSTFPDMGALEITSYFDLLGGKLRPNADFWIHVAARHPATTAGPVLEELVPDSDEWGSFLGRSLAPDLVAAAYKATIIRVDRTQPIEEANYVLRADPMLWEYEYLNDLPAQNRAQAEALAGERAPRGTEVDRVWFAKGAWQARIRTLKPDWEPLARKKARTTAARRVCAKAYSLSEARVLAMTGQAQRVLDAALATRHARPEDERLAIAPGPREGQPGARAAVEVGDVRDLPDDAPAPRAAPIAPPTDASEGFLAEVDRRRLHAWAAERDLGPRDSHKALKALLARVLGVPEVDVSTKRVRYADLPRIQEALEQYPYRDARAPDPTPTAAATPASPAPLRAPRADPEGPRLPFAFGQLAAGIPIALIERDALLELREACVRRAQHPELTAWIDEELEVRRHDAEDRPLLGGDAEPDESEDDGDGLPF